jgi:hypothetical protein
MTLHKRLTACSLCLRVMRDGVWIEAQTAIGELRSFEQEAPPRFKPALCPSCEAALQARRHHLAESLAA